MTKAAAAGATEVEVRIKGADYRPFPAGADFKVFNSATSAYDTVTTITGTNKALIEVPYVGTATPKDATGTRWSSQAAYHEQLVTVAGDGTVAVDRSVVCAPVNIVLNVSSSSAPSGYVLYDDAVVRPNYPNFPPQIKTKKAAGAIIASDGERVSLQQFGGSWWFRAAAANGKLVTPQGNGHMESIDRYQVFRDFYLRRDVVHNKISQLAKAINDPALRATLGVVSDEDHKAAFLAALAERHAMIDERRALFQSLSEVDYAGVESAVAAYDIQTGNRIWVTSGEAPDVSFTPAPLTTPHDAGLERRRGDACLRHAVSAHKPGSRLRPPTRSASGPTSTRRPTMPSWSATRCSTRPRAPVAARRNDWCAAPREHAVIWSTRPGSPRRTTSAVSATPVASPSSSATNSFDYLRDHGPEGRQGPCHPRRLRHRLARSRGTRTSTPTAPPRPHCAKGMVFTMLPTEKAIGVFDAFTGTKLQSLPLPASMTSFVYNNAQVVVDRKHVFLVTTQSVHKYSLVVTAA